MHCTLKNVGGQAPQVREGAVVGRHLLQPGASRHGGLRTAGKYKRRASEGRSPLVTVITVCLNSAKTIEQCLGSVLAQTYDNVEYIVIDGGSTDGTVDLIEKHAYAIDYWLSEPDKGLYQAMNKGLALAAGDYVLVLNSDDWYAADCIASLVAASAYGGADFTSALARYVDAGGKEVEVMRHMPYDDSTLIRMPLRHETMLLPAALYNAVGPYDETYRIVSDFQYTVRLFKAGYSLYELQRPLICFRNTGISNAEPERLVAERARLLRENFPFLDAGEIAQLADLRVFDPDHALALATRHSGQEEFLRALASYCGDRKRTAVAVRWKTSSIRWPSGPRERPRVSLIMPVHNAQSTLEGSIDSVLGQSLRALELICIDDASSDGSAEILKRRAAADPRIVVLSNERNLGPGATRNRGIRRARGDYVFFLDADDLILPGALDALLAHALAHDCDMVKGAYLREQLALEGKPRPPVLENPCPASGPIAAARLADMPALLRATEGHWSSLYSRELALRISYPADLRVGEDSLFLVRATTQARRIGVIADVVYRYRVSADSAMNTFTPGKHMDGIEWRRRAWHVLADSGLGPIGDRLLRTYWRDSFFSELARNADAEQFRKFCSKLRAAFGEAGVTSPGKRSSAYLQRVLRAVIAGQDDDARRLMGGEGRAGDARPVQWKMRVATLCSQDDGGAGTGSQRRVTALRQRGIDARLLVLVARSGREYVRRLKPRLPGLEAATQAQVWEAVRARAIAPAAQVAGFKAKELFSLTDSVLDFREFRELFGRFDVIHLHWVVGMLDYDHVGEVLGEKPIVWTLADMNAFTGGCHYSEGCEEFKRECRRCPLLGGESDLAHEGWQKKKRAYAQLRNLRIICPSPWLAERARQSSLLGDREIEVIPNAYPVDSFALTAKIVARIRLGLPLRKKLLIFGAESLTSHRKGGDLLRTALRRYSARYKSGDVEVLVFGSKTIDLPLPVRSLGYVESEESLALAYSAADAYLFPSREDNAPLTVGEALLCGTPVVAFPVGNVPELVEHKVNGYLAKYKDVDDFASGIAWVLDAAPLAALARSARCRMRASEVHDPALAAERHEALYRRAMGGPG